MTTTRFVEACIQDVRCGLRQVCRSPGLALVIVSSLALGIGANTALFSVVNAVMLNGAPAISQPGRLVALAWTASGDVPDEIMTSQSGRSREGASGEVVGFSLPYPSVGYLRSHARSFSDVVGFVPLGGTEEASAVVRGEPMFVYGEMVTDRYFEALGVRVVQGRTLGPADHAAGAPRVAVISDAFRTRAFAGQASAVGSSITLSGIPVTVVGIAPPGFQGLENGRAPDIWLPMTYERSLAPWGLTVHGAQPARFLAPTYWWLQAFARLKPGVTVEQARAEAASLLRASFADGVPGPLLKKVPGVALLPGATGFSAAGPRLQRSFPVMAAVVGTVLLVACANVATLLLTRATTRRKEMSVRLAMGASRARLFRQLLTEHALYGVAAALAALLLARWAGPVLLSLLQSSASGSPLAIVAGLDTRVLAFTAAVTLLTVLLCGAVPALRAARSDVVGALKDGTGGSTREVRLGRLRLGRVFVAAQIAMTLPLVLGAGAFLRTLANLHAEQLGFDDEKLLLFTLDATKSGHKGAALAGAYGDMRTSLEALASVKSATFSMQPLLTGWVNNTPVSVEGGDDSEQTRADRIAHWNAVGPGFTATMGMRLLLGRTLDERDFSGSSMVAVINETMARKFFGRRSPVGHHFFPGGQRAAPITVVGVVADAKYGSVKEPAPPTFYLAYGVHAAWPSIMTFEVRTAGDPRAIVGDVRRIAARIAPGVPIGRIRTQAAQAEASFSEERMFARLFTVFGVTALLLACIGLYATMAYVLRRRTREIGIRAALGASRNAILGMALRDTLVVAVAGLASGGLLAAAGARLVRSLLFGVTPLDPVTITCGAAVMLAAALAAGYVPAHRACRISPVQALREE